MLAPIVDTSVKRTLGYNIDTRDFFGGAGVLLSQKLAAYLDAAEQKKMNAAIVDSLNGNKPVSWKSGANPNISGSSTSVGVEMVGGKPCRKQRNLVNVGGREVVDEQVYCRANDGTWVAYKV